MPMVTASWDEMIAKKKRKTRITAGFFSCITPIGILLYTELLYYPSTELFMIGGLCVLTGILTTFSMAKLQIT
ncbi:MAG TPA: hypothetical protein VKY40_05525 [Halanaerobiales bacterium]|nr:hypothetical protein [Halanaerobiales bacterium]